MDLKKIQSMQKNTVLSGNVIHFDKLHFAYIAIPKAANTSIKHWLLPLIGKKELDTINIHGKKSIGYSYATNKWLSGHKSNFFSFTIVRNPIDRLYSTFKDKVQRNQVHTPLAKLGFTNDMSFTDFVEKCAEIDDKEADIHIRSQFSMLSWKGTFLPNLIIPLEELHSKKEILKNMIENISHIQLGELPWKNQKVNTSIKERLDTNTLKILQKRYSKDFKLLGYKM